MNTPTSLLDPMHSDAKQPDLAPAVRAVLDALRGRIRGYVWLRGMAAAAACLGAAFWASLAIDWFFEPPPAVRGLMLAAAAVLLGGVLLELIVRRAFVPLADRNLAMLLERRFPQFDESLLTAVELTGRRPETSETNPAMLWDTCRLAAEPVTHIGLMDVFNWRPLGQSMLAAVLFATSVGAFSVQSPEALGVWARRNLLFSPELWPRNTRLVVEGFPEGRAKVARGADFNVIAKADLRMPVVPKVVDVRYTSEGGSWLRESMTREGAAHSTRDEFQEYSYTFRGVLAPIRFDVTGGDDAVRGLRIEVVDSPRIVRMDLDCRFRAYTARPPLVLPVTGVMQIPAGTLVVIRATANKDLVGVQIDSALVDPPQPPLMIEPDSPSDPRSFQHTLEDFTEDTTLLFTLLDADGIKSRQPMRLTLVALDDRPPDLAVQLRGIGSAITARAQLPAAGRVADDHGLARVWFEYAIAQGEPRQEPISSPSGNQTELNLRRALDVRPLELTPGDKLQLSVKAADRCDLAGEPNVGTSDRWIFDVVTADQLRTILDSRELLLRERFKVILQEVVETRDALLQMEFGTSAEAAPGPAAGAEPGDEPEDARADGGVADRQQLLKLRLLNLRRLRVERASQNSQKDAHEILGTAEAFAEIREELINNRIDTEELKIRLEDQIVAPLRRIAAEMFPELDRRLEDLLAVVADDRAGPGSRTRATAQLDEILAAMRQVLARMIELEDFNEAIGILRDIIEAQAELQDQTQRLHKQKLRELLED